MIPDSTPNPPPPKPPADGDTLETRSGTIVASIPGVDVFLRKNPAADELSPEARTLAYQIPAYGGALFGAVSTPRPDRRIRDLVTSALLRRTVVTLEGVRTLIFAGLYEPAMSVTRTLQDLEVSLKLVLQDASDDRAFALAGWHYLQYQRHGTDMLKHPGTRAGLTDPGWEPDDVRRIAKNYAALLRGPTFDRVRSRLEQNGTWHGLPGTKEAFTAAGLADEYWMTYDAASWFVHASNVEHDMVDVTDQGIMFRPFVERDPTRTGVLIGRALLKTLELYDLIAKDRGLDVDAVLGGSATVHIEGLPPTPVNALTALQVRTMSEFDVRADAPIRRAP